MEHCERPIRHQWCKQETLTLDVTVEGKTTKLLFDLVNMDGKKDMMLGHPWHEIYDPDISWKGGGHL